MPSAKKKKNANYKKNQGGEIMERGEAQQEQRLVPKTVSAPASFVTDVSSSRAIKERTGWQEGCGGGRKETNRETVSQKWGRQE